MTSASRRPDFLILGAAKAGTTALFGALSRHPRVFCTTLKEPAFFAYAGSPIPLEWGGKRICDEAPYFELFAGCPPGAVAGEASTEYLSSQRAPAVAFGYVPRARLIAVLRHPVERAFSQYLHVWHHGKEPLKSFESAWEAEDVRIEQGWQPGTHYRTRGFYGRALTRWLSVFPREQLLILFYEDWLEHPERTLDLVWQHLGIEPLEDPVVRRENVSSRQPRWTWLNHRMIEDNRLRRWAQRRLPLAARNAITHPLEALNLRPGPRLGRVLRARLAVTYHDDLKLVEALTGRDLTAWRS